MQVAMTLHEMSEPRCNGVMCTNVWQTIVAHLEKLNQLDSARWLYFNIMTSSNTYTMNLRSTADHRRSSSTIKKSLFLKAHALLQLLQQAAQYGALEAGVVEPVLAMSLQQDDCSKGGQMTDRSRSLLTSVKHTAGSTWPEALQEATVLLLVEALLQESGQLDVTHLFEARTSVSLVLSILTASSRVVKYRCPAVEYL